MSDSRFFSPWQRDVAHLREVLTAASKVRHLRPEFFHGELEWVRHERQVMLDAVNALRARDGRGPVGFEEVVAKERSALGHSDYAQTFAIGCADLVHQSTEEGAET